MVAMTWNSVILCNISRRPTAGEQSIDSWWYIVVNKWNNPKWHSFTISLSINDLCWNSTTKLSIPNKGYYYTSWNSLWHFRFTKDQTHDQPTNIYSVIWLNLALVSLPTEIYWLAVYVYDDVTYDYVLYLLSRPFSATKVLYTDPLIHKQWHCLGIL